MKTKQKTKIVIKSKEITSSSKYQAIEGEINGKSFIVTRWTSYDNNSGSYDNDYDLIKDESDELTEEEEDMVRDYIEDNVEWK